jgi:hypothetical protein
MRQADVIVGKVEVLANLQKKVDELEIENGRLKDFGRLLLRLHKAPIGAPYLEEDRALTRAFPNWAEPEFAGWFDVNGKYHP